MDQKPVRPKNEPPRIPKFRFRRGRKVFFVKRNVRPEVKKQWEEVDLNIAVLNFFSKLLAFNINFSGDQVEKKKSNWEKAGFQVWRVFSVMAQNLFIFRTIKFTLDNGLSDHGLISLPILISAFWN